MNHSKRSIGATALALGVSALSLAAPAATSRASSAYAFTVNQTTSTLTYSFSANAPFSGSMMGENDITRPAAEQTRTKRLATIFSPCGTLTATQNDTVNVSGTIAATGSSTGAPASHPGGTFKLGIDAATSQSVLQDLNLNLVAVGAIDSTANLNNFTYQSFCAINPSCTAPFLVPISLPLGTVSVTSLLVTQAAGVPDTGTLSAAGANMWNFSVPTTVTVTPTVTFGGNPIAADPQQVPATFAGTITVSGNTASITGSATINYTPPTNTTPAPQPPAPFSVPSTSTLCPGINLILSITINSSTVSSNNTAGLVAAGPKIACKCDTNASGTLEVQDIFDFLNLWFAGSPQADFNGGGLGVQDIFDFLACWFSRPLGC
jgi:hypothetical protein